ncbi:hypothetical protein ISS37_10970 [candidate division KSB1 bacterium]|nr:hypothetical protein [candidate division KSB1 bacterium]
MDNLWKIFYNVIVIPLLYCGFWILSPLVGKIRNGVRGRRGLFPRLREDMSGTDPTRPTLWFHCASTGEFEQVKPVIDLLSQKSPRPNIALTCFSPSVFSNIQDYQGADVVCYLPFDSIRNARRFLDIVNPTAMIITKHDVWPNHLWQARARGVWTVLLNAAFPAKSPWFHPMIRSFTRSIFGSFDFILPATQEEGRRFRAVLGERTNIQVFGDSRYDRVSERSLCSKDEIEKLGRELKGKRVIVAGSTWPPCHCRLLPAFARLSAEENHLLLILVPHEPSDPILAEIESLCRSHHLSLIHYSRWLDGKALGDEKIILIDRMGILAEIYRLGEIAYVGGGFGAGLHNVLEAAVYGIPVLFGPRIHVSPEAQTLMACGGGFMVHTQEDFYQLFSSFLSDRERLHRAGEEAKRLVMENLGATQRVCDFLIRNIQIH